MKFFLRFHIDGLKNMGTKFYVYDNVIQNYCVFGLFPSSGILENRKHDVSETGSVSVFR
jgi:hypothetical protein